MENQRPDNIPGFFYQITCSLEPVAGDAACFHASWRRSMTTREHPEHTVVDGIKGQGHYVGTFIGWEQLSNGWWGHAAGRQHEFPYPGASRAGRKQESSCCRRPDGLRPEGLPRVAIVRRRRLAAAFVAGGEAGARVCVGEMGCRPRRGHGGRAAQHLRHQLLRPQLHDGDAVSGRAGGRLPHGRASGRNRNCAEKKYEALRAAGAAKLDRLLWNGEYFVQKVDESARGARKYQYGEGCLSDQLLGQWFAEVAGLGRLLPREHIRAALASIFRFNFRAGFEEFPNTQRIFATDGEAGLLLCTWPKGKRPALPFVYCDEVWTGIEYQVAAHLIYEGLVKEGVAIVNAVRSRYDGAKRNRWDEVELGHHYARAMSSWSRLTAFSGFHYSAPSRELGFHPRKDQGQFRALFVAGSAWGTYSQESNHGSLKAELIVEEGVLDLATLRLPLRGKLAKVECAVPHAASQADGGLRLEFRPPQRVAGGAKLALTAEAV